jgi:NAD(P)-dependent dehydrogenase (short-subunit alcohol dehydrogenase family)
MKQKIILTGYRGLIGKKIFNFLKKKNYKVVGLDIKDGHDLTDVSFVSKIMKNYKNYDYLVNLHGVNDHIENKKLYGSEPKDLKIFDRYFHTNVYSNYLTNIFFIKNAANPKGIVNFASQYAIQAPKHFIYKRPKNIFYVASKFSVIGLTKYLASFYGKRLSINCIVNSGIEANQPIKFKKKLINHIPKKRMMKVSDLFGILEFLLSEKSEYTNGSIINIDGGYSSW